METLLGEDKISFLTSSAVARAGGTGESTTILGGGACGKSFSRLAVNSEDSGKMPSEQSLDAALCQPIIARCVSFLV